MNARYSIPTNDSTTAPRPNAELMLRALGLADPPAFEVLVIGTECARAKPFPDPYLEGMRLLGATDPARCVAFEDSPTGMAAAVAAGAPSVGVTTSQSPAALFGAGCVLSAISPTMPLLLAGRALQGLGGGGLVSMGFVAVGVIFPRRYTAGPLRPSRRCGACRRSPAL